ASDRYYSDALMSRFQWKKSEKPLFMAWMNLCYSNRFYFSGDFEKSHTLSDAALNAFLELNLSPFLPLAYFQVSLTSYYRSKPDDGLNYAQKGIFWAEKNGIRDHQYAWLLYARALNEYGTGDIPSSFQNCEESFSIFRDYGNVWGQATVCELTGMLYGRIGKPEQAENWLETGLNILGRLQLTVIRHALMLRLAGIRMEQGKWEPAFQILNHLQPESVVSTFQQFQRHILLVRMDAIRNHPEQASETLLPALELCQRYHYHSWIILEFHWITPLLSICRRSDAMKEVIEEIFIQSEKRPWDMRQSISSKSDLPPRQTPGRLNVRSPENNPDPLFISCLGPFHLRIGLREISSWNWHSLSATRLFKFLILKIDNGFIPKDVLMEWLWPETDPIAGRNRFHVALSALRKILEPELKRGMSSAYIVRQKDAYRLEIGSNGQIDFKEFLFECEMADQQMMGNETEALPRFLQAESIYKGPLFEEDPFEDVFIPDRDRLQNRYLHVLRTIIHQLEQQEKWTGCIRYAEKYLTIDPCSEWTYGTIMRGYA
ncbi:MAG: BTAD domain-containing putative transcriptional regulator, partial [Desulfatirhabdiaceae bacterium]